jgi:NAD(P)-dependent dehydrogenase (short-subunit alcohol dehydrogenase family)
MKVVLVTGGGTGIGAAIAARAAHDGWQVVITGRRRDPLEAVAAAHPGIRIEVGDSSDEAVVQRVVGRIREDFGRLDAVVANAGIMVEATAEETELATWNEVLRVNLTGPYLLARAAMPMLRESRGAFVAIGSISGLRASTRSAAYATSKAGLSMLVRSIAIDEGAAGVRANIVCPGWVGTEMADEEMDRHAERSGLRDRDAAYADLTSLVPARRPGRPEEIAGAVAWLIGEDSGYVNAAEIVVDGGTVQVDAGTAPFAFSITPRHD